MLILLILVIQLKKTDQNTKTNEKKPLIMIILGIGPTQGLDDSFSANNMKKKGLNGFVYDLLLIIKLLTLVILSISINI